MTVKLNRLTRCTAAAALVVAIAAAGCASEPEPAAPAPTTTAPPPATTAADAVTTATTPPPTTAAPLTEEQLVEVQAEIAEVVEEASPEDVPEPEVVAEVMEAVEEAAPESVLTLQDCTDWVADSDIVLDDQQTAECTAMLAAAVEACEGLECDPSPEPEPEPEPEVAPATTVPAPVATEPEDTTPAAAPAEPAPEETATTLPPEPEPEPTTTTVPPEPEVEVVYIGQWVPPEAGMVPVPLPECSDDSATWDESCTPPPNWDYGEFIDGRRSAVPPRQTPIVVDFTNNCFTWNGAPCRAWLGLMKMALDYLGAHPSCVDFAYSDRLRAFIRNPNASSDVMSERHGWHNCATVIDPLVRQPPDGRVNDIGYRLSDTGISLADQCRAVLPEDVMLEGFAGPLRDDGTFIPATRFASGHAGCDDWAEWAETRTTMSVRPGCFRADRLAEEWMEHHHGVHERYLNGLC